VDGDQECSLYDVGGEGVSDCFLLFIGVWLWGSGNFHPFMRWGIINFIVLGDVYIGRSKSIRVAWTMHLPPQLRFSE
jgi:hypothetical protein